MKFSVTGINGDAGHVDVRSWNVRSFEEGIIVDYICVWFDYSNFIVEPGGLWRQQ
ncbi:MAG: hypothetical protein R2911_36875 [Caldilineaceae bacterium]